MKRLRVGPRKVGAKVVSKIRRTSKVAYTDSWETIKKTVKNRDGHKCRRCRNTEFLQVDHIIPISKGGRTIMANLWTLCDICHSKRPGHKLAKALILHSRNKQGKSKR